MTTTTTGFLFTEEWSLECNSNIPHDTFRERIESLKIGHDIKFLSLSTKYVNYMMVDYVIAFRSNPKN